MKSVGRLIVLAFLATGLLVTGGSCLDSSAENVSPPVSSAKEETSVDVGDADEEAVSEESPAVSSGKRVAAIVTSYFPGSHADVIVGKFLRGFPTDEGLLAPRTKIVSLFIDQVHRRDIGRQVAYKYKIPLYESIRGALTLGGDTLAVDAVLLIGEHGDYATSELGQEMPPRRYFFEQISAVINEADRAIPVYNDKHFSYRFDDARWMYQTARRSGIPFWAASALPVVWRKPNWEHPQGETIDGALVIGFHMVERYGYHALEVLQSQVERRRGGETGVRSVQCLSGDEVWQAAKNGRWSIDLANVALGRIEGGPRILEPEKVSDPHVFLVEYVDGLQATVLMLGDGYVKKFAYAQQRGDVTDSLEYHTDSGPTHAAFGYLGRNIENFLISGQVPNPVERTYLVTGILEAAMISRGRGGRRVTTPHLAEIRYQPAGQPLRPGKPRPSGASLGEWPNLEPGATPTATSISVGRDGTTRGPQARKKIRTK